MTGIDGKLYNTLFGNAAIANIATEEFTERQNFSKHLSHQMTKKEKLEKFQTFEKALKDLCKEYDVSLYSYPTTDAEFLTADIKVIPGFYDFWVGNGIK